MLERNECPAASLPRRRGQRLRPPSGRTAAWRGSGRPRRPRRPWDLGRRSARVVCRRAGAWACRQASKGDRHGLVVGCVGLRGSFMGFSRISLVGRSKFPTNSRGGWFRRHVAVGGDLPMTDRRTGGGRGSDAATVTLFPLVPRPATRPNREAVDSSSSRRWHSASTASLKAKRSASASS